MIKYVYKGGTKMKSKKNVFYIGLLFAVMTFILFYVAISFALKQEITIQNYIAYFVFSLLVGLIVMIFAKMKHNLGLIIFSVSYFLAFGVMIYSFMSDLSGWQDLAGILQMMFTLGIGLALGLVAQLVLYLIDRRKKS